MRRVAIPLGLTRHAAAPRGGRRVVLCGPAMGVSWNLQALAPAGVTDAALAAAVQGAVNTVVAQMSDWEVDSDLSRFNRAPAGAWIEAPAHLMSVVAAGLRLAELTDGAFDPTMGAVVDLWGFGPRGGAGEPPDPQALAEARAGWRELGLDAPGGRIRQSGGLSLDLSGIAKGYGVDLAALALERLGLRDFLIEIGGELRGSGVKGDGEPWWVELEPHPQAAPDEPPTLVALHGLAIATSGDWRRAFVAGGRRYSHTIDPRTRRPVSGDLAAVTVLHPLCAEADALCTALLVLGADAFDFAARRGVAARFVTRGPDGLSESFSPAFEALLN